MDMRGKRVVVTGGSSGIGLELARQLARKGARLVLTAVNQLERAGGRRALATLCVGVGQGLALAVEKV